MRHLVTVAPVALALLLAGAPAWAGKTLTGKPKVSFFAVGNPGLLDIEGVTREVTVADSGESLTFTVSMNTVETGISLRDSHMRDNYVEVAKYPDVVLTVPTAEVTWPQEQGETATGTVGGTFTAHGKDAPVQVEYEVKRLKSSWKVDAKFPFDIRDHGMSIPSYLTVTVEPEMRAEVSLELEDAP